MRIACAFIDVMKYEGTKEIAKIKLGEIFAFYINSLSEILRSEFFSFRQILFIILSLQHNKLHYKYIKEKIHEMFKHSPPGKK